MAIQFVCPHCRTKTQVAEQYAGQSGPCAACGKTVTIPYPGSPSGAGGGSGIVVTLLLVFGVVGGLLLLCVVGAGIFVYSGVGQARAAAQRMQSSNNLKQIGLALHNYHDVYREFPPAYVTDKDGKPLYSWRVLILPFVESQGLYSQFNLNESWDSPQNLPLSQQMPFVFRSPTHTGPPNTTDYAAFSGAETMFNTQGKMTLNNVTDGTSNTIMAVEVKSSTINWAEPRDIPFDKSTFTINAASDDIGSANETGCNVLLGDGSVRFLKRTIPPGVIKQMVTKSGGEVVNIDQY